MASEGEQVSTQSFIKLVRMLESGGRGGKGDVMGKGEWGKGVMGGEKGGHFSNVMMM